MTNDAPLTLDQLKAKCDSTEKGECWEWKGAYRDPQRRLWPVISWRTEDGDKAYFYVRHLMVWIKKGKRPSLGRFFSIVPGCGDDQCVNPDHMKVVSRKQVVKKTVEAGHMSAPERCRKIATTKRKVSSLSDADVAEIRTCELSVKDAAQQYGVSEAYIRMLRRYEWRQDFRSPFAGLGG